MPSADSLAVRVLTDRALMRHVIGCLRGIPQFVLEFQRDVVPKFFNVKPLQYSRCRRVPPDFPKRAGLLPHVAIAANDQKMLEALFELSKQPQCARMERMSFSQAMRCAAFCGRLEMLQWMVCVFATDPSWIWEPQLVEKAMLNIDTPPSVELLEWLYEHCPPVCREIRDPEKMLVQHTKHGNLDVVRFFYTRGHAISQPAIDAAAWSRNLELVRFLHDTYPDGFTVSAMDFAASNGHLEIVKFLHDNRTEGCTVHAMSQAAANGHLQVVQYLHEAGKPCNQKAMTDAAANGHISVVRFLHFNRSEGCTQDAMDKIDHQLTSAASSIGWIALTFS